MRTAVETMAVTVTYAVKVLALFGDNITDEHHVIQKEHAIFGLRGLNIACF